MDYSELPDEPVTGAFGGIGPVRADDAGRRGMLGTAFGGTGVEANIVGFGFRRGFYGRGGGSDEHQAGEDGSDELFHFQFLAFVFRRLILV
jgi:hypothetical protein